MPPEDDREKVALFDIAHAARLAMAYVQGLSREAFERDEKTQDTVIRRLIILGEASKRVGDSVKATHPALPWKQMAGMRDVIVHDYDRVELDTVWAVLTRELPPLLEQVEAMLQ